MSYGSIDLRRSRAPSREGSKGILTDMLPCPNWPAATWERLERHTRRRPRLYEQPLTRETIESRWDQLSEREREALRLYFAVDPTPGARATYRSIGAQLGVCESRVWQLVHNGLSKLSGSRKRR